MKKRAILIFIFFSFVLSFFAGVKWSEFNYDDICLDMGGGKKPGNYPICVIEKEITKKDDTIYFCDEFGNKFVSEDEARRCGLSDAEFGATYCLE